MGDVNDFYRVFFSIFYSSTRFLCIGRRRVKSAARCHHDLKSHHHYQHFIIGPTTATVNNKEEKRRGERES